MANKPYIKQYDENGVLANPIIGSYSPTGPNRRQRNNDSKKKRFHGESKNFHLTVYHNMKFRRRRQVVFMKDGSKKTIEHYDEKY